MQLAPIIQQALLAETEELDLAHAQVDDLLALASGLACGLGSPPGGEATHHIVENEVRAFRTRLDTDLKIRNHIRQIQALGFEVTITKTA